MCEAKHITRTCSVCLKENTCRAQNWYRNSTCYKCYRKKRCQDPDVRADYNKKKREYEARKNATDAAYAENVRRRRRENARKHRKDPEKNEKNILRNLARRGADLSTYAVIKEKFSGKCFSCGVSEPSTKKGFHRDHCHATGKFRGFVCQKCNILAGYIEKNPGLLENVLAYLRDGV